MDNSFLVATVEKLAKSGECAGLSIDEMIHILDAGFTVEELIRLIDSRLAENEPLQPLQMKQRVAH